MGAVDYAVDQPESPRLENFDVEGSTLTQPGPEGRRGRRVDRIHHTSRHNRGSRNRFRHNDQWLDNHPVVHPVWQTNRGSLLVGEIQRQPIDLGDCPAAHRGKGG